MAPASERESRKYTFAGPYRADVDRSIRILYENVVLHSRIVWRVAMAGIFLDVQVRDQDKVEALLAQVGDHVFKIREILPVDGEVSIDLLLAVIKADGLGRKFLFSIAIES